MLRGIIGALPDLNAAEQDLVATGNSVAVRYVVEGTQQGNLLGIPPSGRRARWNVRGRFTGISGTIVDAGEDPIYSSVKSAIDVTTLVTGDPQRDEHLRSPDFFDVAKYPVISVESRKISGSREKFRITGDLSVHGVTREIVLDVTFNGTGTNPLGKTVAGFTAETKINRKDFGLNWNMALEAGGFLVGDEAKILIEMEAVREDPTPSGQAA